MCWDERPKDIPGRIVSVRAEDNESQVLEGSHAGRECWFGAVKCACLQVPLQEAAQHCPAPHRSAEHPKAPLLKDVPRASLSSLSLSSLQQSPAVASLGSQAVPVVLSAFLLIPVCSGENVCQAA